jgi:hypothetical protein
MKGVDGKWVHTDVEVWREIRRKVLVDGVSKCYLGFGGTST